MKYALGNMLNGAGGLNADQLALDLQFAEDKTLTARKGPSPILTRGSTGTFVGSNGLIQTAASGLPRFDHDPVSPFACRGLLIEEGRTNLLQRSEEFDNIYWTPTRAPQPTANAAVSPDGATTADKLIADTTAANNHRVDRSPVTLALNTIYTVSVFAKASEYTGIALGVGLAATQGVNYSLVGAGTATPVSGAGHTGTIQQLANGWYRCTATFTSDATTAGHRVAIYVGQNGTTFSYTGDNTSGIFIWGAQIEAGSFATSYIPTTTSALARSADVCSITGANFTSFYNQPEGTLFADVTPQTVAQSVFILGVNTTTFNNSHTIFKSDNSFNNPGRRWGAATYAGALVSQIATSTDVATTRARLAYAYKLNDMVFAASGSIIGTDTSGTMPSPTIMHIGNREGSLQINGHLAAIRYYKLRLPNAKLQALTA